MRPGRFVCWALFVVLALVAGLSVALSPAAGAYATIAPSPLYSSATGLPDGRMYEQVSPANKNGNAAGAALGVGVEGQSNYSAAAAGGDAVMFFGTSALGQSNSGFNQYFVARRSPGGAWQTSSMMPRQAGIVSILGPAVGLYPSADLSRLVFTAGPQGVYAPPPAGTEGANIYLAAEDGNSSTWAGQPGTSNSTGSENPLDIVPAGGSPDLGTFYYAYAGTLLPEDEPRIPNTLNLHVGEAAWGFYEYRDGVLSEAGVLPGGGVDPRGAVPAGLAARSVRSQVIPSQLGNQVSVDGSRAFFVSPDPMFCAVAKSDPCAGDPPELYVRESTPGGGARTVLVSRSQLAGHAGEPAVGGSSPYGDFYATPDGLHVFFASRDRLVDRAPEGAGVKTYELDLATERLEYLPGVVGPVLTASQDGSSFVFENTEASPEELSRWSAGTVTPIVQLPAPTGSGFLCGEEEVRVCVRGARTVEGGSVVVFATNALIRGFNDSGGQLESGVEQVYRYDAGTGELGCVSCPPAGVVPSGSVNLSRVDQQEGGAPYVVGDRGVSGDGSRVFFDTPDRLVPQDTNGVRDVYEWENGEVFLISSGTSPEGSLFLDNSESGGDVFFATTAGLVAGDTDGGYDVYDARVPRLGEPAPSEVPCAGDVCQGPPSVPQLLSPPASATFSGVGNIQPIAEGKPKSKVKAAKPKKKHKAKRKTRKTYKRLGKRRNVGSRRNTGSR